MLKKIIFYLVFLFALFGQEELEEIEKELKEAEKRSEEERVPVNPTARLVPVRQRTGFIIDRSSIPEIFVATDLVYEQDVFSKRRETKNNIDVREVEFGFSGYIDWFAHGSALFALHRDDHQDLQGRYIFDIHELIFDFYNLPANFRMRAGKMFLDAGRLNTIHRHDWFFTNAPLIHKVVMNDLFVGEGAADTGLEVAYLMPWSFFQELKVGVFRGRIFGHGHTDGIEKPAPLWLGRLKQFFPIVGNLGTEFGFTFLRYHPTQEAGDIDYTYGADITFRWFQSRIYRFIFTTEFWYKEFIRQSLQPKDSVWGIYSFFDFIFMQNYSIGYRFDIYEDRYAIFGKSRNYLANTFWFTWRPSEFAYYRINVEQKNYSGYDGLNGINYLLYVQGTYILGFHMPHRY